MQIQEFEKEFFSELQGIYPKEEITSLFHILMDSYTEFSRIDLLMNPEKGLKAEEKSKLTEGLKRLQKEEPLQYIVGETEFYGMSFQVNPSVLIPRPETEELVSWVLDEVKVVKNLNILDIGTGSGCIPISIAKHTAHQVFGFDISEKALHTARQNAALNQVEVNFRKADILNPPKIEEQFDVVVSNPPYIPQAEKSKMQKNVVGYEPEIALFVEDDDALLFYREIIKFTQEHGKPTAKLYFEINEYLQQEMESLLQEFGLENYTFKKDHFGKYRMLSIDF